jgi:RNA polymerase sigma-70 factor (TIGR02943 family)
MKRSPDKQPSLDPTYWLDHHGDYLYRYALTRVRDAAVAEDLLQETLLAAMRGYQEHERRSSERTWLVGILRHKIVDHFRRLARTPEFQVESAEVGADADFFEREGPWRGHWREDQAPVIWPVDAVTLLESKEFWETFERCLKRLSPQTAAAFTLREIEGLSSEEICEILGVSPNNLWVLLHRGRVKLRHFLEAEWFRGNRPTAPVAGKTQLLVKVAEFPAEFTMRAVAV